MYLSYKHYRELGGTMDEGTYASHERRARHVIDDLTQQRLHDAGMCRDIDQLGDWGRVRGAMYACIARLDRVDKARAALAEGTMLSSFSNGEDSFGFSSGSMSGRMTQAELEMRAAIIDELPYYLACAMTGEWHDMPGVEWDDTDGTTLPADTAHVTGDTLAIGG